MPIAMLAGIGQIVVPLICLVGAGISAFKRSKRDNLVSHVSQGETRDVLNGMSWREFEVLVSEAFRLQGYLVAETGGGGADGGVDLILTRGNETIFVQCKQWKTYQVGVKVVRELFGVMAARKATAGIVVTSGRFTNEALEFAKGHRLKLMDGQELFGLIQRVKGRAPATPPLPESARMDAATQLSVQLETTPACPKCSTQMVRRTARRGANAGNDFWGCPKYPTCRGTREMLE